MLLVLVGHTPPSLWTSHVIYSFHIPFFFALSGFLHNPARHVRFVDLLQARWRTLVLPYLAYSVIGYFGVVGQEFLLHHVWSLNPTRPIVAALLGLRNSSIYHGTLWFVVCLLMTEFIYFALYHLVRRNAFLVFLLSLPLAAYSFHPLVKVPFFPWSLDAALVAIVFFSFGQLVRGLRTDRPQEWFSPPTLAIAGLVWLGGLFLEGKVDMYSDTYETPVYFLVTALAGIVLVFRLVPLLRPVRWIGYVGRHSLVYLALHQWLAFNIANRILNPLRSLPFLQGSLGFGILALLTTCIALLLLWPVCEAFDRWAPFLVGGGSKRPASPSVPCPEGGAG